MVDKLVKVTANVPVRDTNEASQTCWGVVFDVVEVKKDHFSLVAEVSVEDAKAMKKAGRVG